MTKDEANHSWEEFNQRYESGDHARAESEIDRLIAHFTEAGKTGNLAICLQRKAILCETLDRMHEANAYHRQAFCLCAEGGLEFLPVVALNAALCLERSGNPDNALAVLREAVGGQIGISDGLVEAFRRLAALDPDATGCRSFIQGVVAKRSPEDQIAIVQAIASDYFERKEYLQALDYYRIVEAVEASDLAKFTVYQAIGICHSQLAEYGQAITYLMTAGVIALKTGDAYALAALNLNLGIAYAQNGQRAEAEARFSDAQGLAKQHGFTDVLGQIEGMVAKGLLKATPRSGDPG